jgi:fatty-acyl-CoA synthase
LQKQAEARPEAVGLNYLGSAYTWRELADKASALAGALQSIGVAKGDRVALFMQNCPEFVVSFYALMGCGAVATLLNPMNKAREVAYCVSHAQAKVAIASADIAGEFVKANELLEPAARLEHLVAFPMSEAIGDESLVPTPWQKWLCTSVPVPELPGGQSHDLYQLIAQNNAFVAADVAADDLALLMFTSGTPGSPKACMHSNATILPNVMAQHLWQDINPGDSLLVVVPMFHITGLVGGLLGAVYAGGKVVLLPRWDRRLAASLISSEKVTHWTNIPTMVIDLLAEPDLDQFDLSSLRFIGGGGAQMPEAIAERLLKQFGLKFVEAYGLTETAAPTHINPCHAPRQQCLGIPHINTRAMILDTDKMREAELGELGEIVVAGPQVFLGYWQNPEATNDVFVEIDGQRWFRTGDLGRMDEDGYFYIADRLKRMINASGFKVWPAELEGLLHQHEAIQEVCVISKTDPYRGQSVKAAIVLRSDAPKDITEKDIITWCRDNMAVYKVPRDIEFVEALPKGATGKILWKVLQAQQDEADKAAEA